MGDDNTRIQAESELSPRRSPKPAQKVPPALELRNALRAAAARRVQERALVAPLSLEELRENAAEIVAELGADRAYQDFITVLVGNETWRETMAGIPFERRVLLLPQCLKDRLHCQAPLDEIGLLCQNCGHCTIGDFLGEAETLGYVALVAEGTSVVTQLLEQGRVDAVIGVSCLHVLEKAFPHAAAHAIPSIAIPLHRDGCEATDFDRSWLREILELRSAARWAGRVDIDELRQEVDAWFRPEELRQFLNLGRTATEDEALNWLAQGGKRWRPVLTACVYRTLAGCEEKAPTPPGVRKVAIATECFHKASLLHDDLEDHDDFRYGQPTPGLRLGMPIALNLGDYLIGEGYRLLAESGLPADRQARLLRVAAEGHRSLCLGQGAELCWMREPRPLSTEEVLGIFRQKTAPAFEVALRLGAICAGADEIVETSLHHFSEALGVAFQIRDDLEDGISLRQPGAPDRPQASILVAIACEQADAGLRERLVRAWHAKSDISDAQELLREVSAALKVEARAQQLLEHYRNEAIRSLSGLTHSHLKGLLRRLVGRVLGAATPPPK
jgi:geranylgeranyl diphosphate synthase, type II